MEDAPALHRKARSQQVGAPSASRFDLEEDVERPARPLRMMASASGNRRRWNRRDDLV
jgi:hypothetical protein